MADVFERTEIAALVFKPTFGNGFRVAGLWLFF